MRKWAHELNREFSNEEVQVISQYMKKCSISLVIKGCKSKQHVDLISSQLKYPYSRAITTTNSGKDVVKQEPLYIFGGNANS
jgi:hypothetical protein